MTASGSVARQHAGFRINQAAAPLRHSHSLRPRRRHSSQATGRLYAVEERAAVRDPTFARRCDLVAVTDAVLARVERALPSSPFARSIRFVSNPSGRQLSRNPAGHARSPQQR